MLLSSAWRWPFIFALPLIWIAALIEGGNTGALFPIVLTGVAGGTYLFWQAALRKRWALQTVLVIAITGLSITFRQRQIGDPSLDGQTGMKILWWIGMLGVSFLNYDRVLRFIGDRVLMAFGCYCLILMLSTAYSPAAMVTFTTALGITACLMFGCLLANEIPIRTLIVTLIWAFALVTLINIVSAVIAPDVAYLQDDPEDILKMRVPTVRLQGMMGNPNNLARYTSIYAILVFIAAWRGYVRPRVWVPNALQAAGVLWASHSRTSISALVLGLLLQLPRHYLFLLASAGILVALGVLMTGQVDAVLSLAGRDGSADETLSMAGRADLWDFTWRLITQRPIIGYGFNSFESYAGTLWTGPAASGVAAHNNYLSILYSTGILGAVPFVTAFAILVYRRVVAPEVPRDFFTVNVLITGFSEIDCFSAISFVPTLIFIIVIAADAWERLSGATRISDA